MTAIAENMPILATKCFSFPDNGLIPQLDESKAQLSRTIKLKKYETGPQQRLLTDMSSPSVDTCVDPAAILATIIHETQRTSEHEEEEALEPTTQETIPLPSEIEDISVSSKSERTLQSTPTTNLSSPSDLSDVEGSASSETKEVEIDQEKQCLATVIGYRDSNEKELADKVQYSYVFLVLVLLFKTCRLIFFFHLRPYVQSIRYDKSPVTW